MKILVTGGSGQLAREFVRTLQARKIEVAAPDERDCDITDPKAIDDAMRGLRPDVVLNCAAYNLVDRAEQEQETAHRVNAVGPRLLAEAARRSGARMLHFSSDYVFDGARQDALYNEEDAPNPLNSYGRSKLAGEQAVREVLGEGSLVFRLSWVFGPGEQNFVRKFLDRIAGGRPLAASYDEFSVPTWTGTVVRVALEALEQGLTGLYHLTNSGYCSRFEWARLILRSLGQERFLRPVPMASFGLPARRPAFSAMSNRSVSRALDIPIEPWEEVVAAFVRQGRDA